MRLELRRQAERLAEMFHRFIRGKPRTVSRDFEQDSPRLAEVDGMEILPIDHGSDVEPERRQRFTPLQLCCLVRYPECDMMHRAGRDVAKTNVRALDQIEVSGRGRRVERKAATALCFTNQLEAERLGQQLFGRFCILHFERGRVKSTQREFRGHISFEIEVHLLQMSGRDQLEHQPVGIGQSQSRIAKARRDFFPWHMLPGEARLPIGDRLRGECKTCRDHLSGSTRAALCARPRKKGNNRSRPADSIAEVKVVATRIVEIDSAFDQAQSKHLRVKVDITLRIGRNSSDMVGSEKFHSSPLIDACICGEG